MSVVIRPRTEEDIPALAQVLVRVHEKDGYPVEGVADPEAWLRSDRMLGAWVAELDGRPVGQVMLAEPGEGDEAARMLANRDGIALNEIAVMCRLFVDPNSRGQRIGKELIDAAVAPERCLGRHLVRDVMPKDSSAIRLYRRIGWKELGSFTHEFYLGSASALAFCFSKQEAS